MMRAKSSAHMPSASSRKRSWLRSRFMAKAREAQCHRAERTMMELKRELGRLVVNNDRESDRQSSDARRPNGACRRSNPANHLVEMNCFVNRTRISARTGERIGGTHAPRVLAMAPRQRELIFGRGTSRSFRRGAGNQHARRVRSPDPRMKIKQRDTAAFRRHSFVQLYRCHWTMGGSALVNR